MEFMTEDGQRTYEDIQELYAALGWGCKNCGQLSSPEWWQTSGDTYCKACKKEMTAELGRLRWHKYPTRKASGLPQTVVYVFDPKSEGHAYAEWSRNEYARLRREYAHLYDA